MTSANFEWKVEICMHTNRKKSGSPTPLPNYLLPDDNDTEFEGAVCVDADSH